MKTIACKVVIPTDRQLHISVPEDVPLGPAEVVVVIVPEGEPEKRGTAGDLLRSPLFGIWKDRTDIGTASNMPESCGPRPNSALMSDADLVLDTDVLIEILRGDSRAGEWLASVESLVLGIPVIIWMEILVGARDKQEQRGFIQQLAGYTILHLKAGDSDRARQWFEQFHLSHGVGILDCLIAAIPLRLAKPFYTFNLKHFHVIPRLEAKAPYERLQRDR
jgi:predicted nucleic acid-binding protein